jgi:hypothetical protein
MSEEPNAPKTHLDKAELLLRSGRTPSTAPGVADVTGVIRGVGFALLAIHDELRAIREHVVPKKGGKAYNSEIRP